jgi:two-component sensor histidine kinase
MAMGKYRLAEKHYLDMLQRSEHIFTIRLEAHLRLGKLYRSTGQYAAARRHLQKALSMCEQRPVLIDLRDIRLQLFKLDSVQARFFPAIAHYQQYKVISDSLFNESRNNQLISVQTQHEIEKKNHHIALLTQRSKVQQATIGQRQAERNALIAGTGLLLTMLSLIYNRYRLKQRSNQQLKAQQQLLEAKQAEVEDKNQLLQGLLGEKDELVEQKEWLLKEVHHRVKNNLQIIISLLQSQGRYLSDETALNAINQSKHRVRAMALIHQKLYRSDNLSSIDVPEYLHEVVEQLAESFDTADRIRFDYQLAPLELDVVQAVPLGLIVNEAVTNALKYAFPQGRPGTVRLSLRPLAGPHYELVVEDDGVGLPPGLALERSHSMGAKIMRGLSKQLEGSLKVESQRGVTITVSFLVSPILLPGSLNKPERVAG